MFKFGSFALVLASGIALSHAAGIRVPVPHAVRFQEFNALDPRQQELLEQSRLGLGSDSAWQQWAASHDGEAAAFLAITQALVRTEVELLDGQKLRALDLVERVREFKGDRIYVDTRTVPFQQWMNSGGRFKFLGTDESGRVNFNGGDIAGSLHEGFDRQGYTSRFLVPRIQWNYRYSDGVADIDLDGYQPLKGGWIPNPAHLTWENSDVRYWIGDYQRKFGAPGFQIQW